MDYPPIEIFSGQKKKIRFLGLVYTDQGLLSTRYGLPSNRKFFSSKKNFFRFLGLVYTNQGLLSTRYGLPSNRNFFRSKKKFSIFRTSLS
jgi:hypothetical protein